MFLFIFLFSSFFYTEEIITYDSLMNNAYQHLRIKNYDEALALVNRARIIKPSSEVFNLSGRINYEKGLQTKDTKYFNQAVDSFKRSINLKKTASSYYNLGLAYLNLSDSKKAIACFNKSKEIDPQYKNASSATALLFLKLGDILNAIEVYESILDEDSKSLDSLVNVACLYAYNSVAKDELRHAKAYAIKALEIEPENLRARDCLNNIERIQGMQNQGNR